MNDNNIVNFVFTKEKRLRLMCTVLEKIRNKKPADLLTEYEIPMIAPIDISTLLEKIGISTIAKDFSDIEDIMEVKRGSILGAAFSNGDNLAIFYKKSDTYNRKIFTIAHELGHCCNHAENLKISHIEFRTTSNNLSEREVDVNVFAGELLIPESLLIEEYNKFIIPSLQYLSKLFGVSSNVMAARLDYLDLDYFKDTIITEE